MIAKFFVPILTAIVLVLSISNCVLAEISPTGSFTISIQGYLLVGTLTDATGHQSGVRLLMSIDRSLSTTSGSLHIMSNAIWNGELEGSLIAGSIDNLTGSVHACMSLTCENATFTGNGNWTGVLQQSSSLPQASGTFRATLYLSNPASTVPVSGNWTSSLNI